MVASLPAVNACLNALAALLLITGWVAIRRGNMPLHRACMVAALFVSTAFLGSYLTYHTVRQYTGGVGSTPFPSTDPFWRTVYFAVLVPHIVLAAAMLVPIAMVLRWAYRADFAHHKAMARWTLPVWLYVSITGVVVYVMLYQINWA